MGYRLVIFPMSAFRAMMKSVAALFCELKEKGTLKDALGQMQTRAELYELLGYDQLHQTRRSVGCPLSIKRREPHELSANGFYWTRGQRLRLSVS